MGFHETQFPTDINYGSSGGPGFLTDIIELDSGAEQRVSRWNDARRRYDAAYQIRSHDQLSTLVTFYIARKGSGFGFRYKDFSDFTTHTDHRSAVTMLDESIGTGYAGNLTFQLVKRYNDGIVTRVRNICKPVAGTVVVAVDDVEQTEGVDWSVDTTTGIVTFLIAPADGLVVTAGCEFDVPVRFSSEADQQMEMIYDSFSSGSTPSIILQEIIDDVETADEFFYGGSQEHLALATNISITELGGRVRVVDPTTGGLKIFLPDTTNLPSGGPYFYIVNINVTNAILLRDSADGAVFTIPANSGVTVTLSDDGVGGKTWRIVA